MEHLTLNFYKPFAIEHQALKNQNLLTNSRGFSVAAAGVVADLDCHCSCRCNFGLPAGPISARNNYTLIHQNY
jgi:hypothetical protein